MVLTAEADKTADNAKADCAAPPPSADSSEDKPKQDAPEQNSAAPVEPSGEDKTDDEGAASNKTSMESLKETNDNNSNNSHLTHSGTGGGHFELA